MVVPEASVADGLNDAAKFQSPHSGAGKEGGEQEVVSRAHHDHLIPALVDILQQTVARPPCAQNHHPLDVGWP